MDRKPEDLAREMRAVLRGGGHVAIGPSSSVQGSQPPADELEERRDTLAEAQVGLTTELHDLLTQHDPVSVLSALSFRYRSLLVPHEGAPRDTAAETFTWDAKMEYLHGLALSSTRAEQDPPVDVINRISDLTDELFDLEQDRILLSSLITRGESTQPIDGVAFVLRLEHLLDRMEGYAEHLEELYSCTFESLRSDCEAELGFCPADVTPLVRRFVTAMNDELNLGRDTMFELLREHGENLPDPSSLEDATMARIRTGFQRMFEFAEWDAGDVARHAGTDESSVRTILDSVASSWESQPSFRLPSEPNLARAYPVTPLGTGRYWVPRPWDLVHSLGIWLTGEIQSRSLDGLKRKVETARKRCLEVLTAERLKIIFGAAAVFENQHYDSAEGHGEVDSLVASGDMPIIVECKSGSLTPSGRRGAPSRVERVVQDVMAEGLDQLRRASTYVTNGGREYAPRQGAQTAALIDERVSDVIRILVTYERMDPLASQAGRLTHAEDSPGTWVVGIADFMMVSDVLTHPAEFVAYARRRCQLAESKALPYVESDLLGAFLEDRLSDVLETANRPEYDLVTFGYTSTAVNQYFTFREMGQDPSRPSTSVPGPILAFLSEILEKEAWASVACLVMDVEPSQWRTWARYARRRLNRQQESDIKFDFPGKPLTISISNRTDLEVEASGDINLLINRSGITRSDLLP